MRETVRAVIVNSKKQVFLVQHRELDPINLGKWATPGGGLEYNDSSHIDGLKRELREEFGSDALQHLIFGPLLRVSRLVDRVDYFYGVHFGGESLIPQAQDEILETGWFKLEEAGYLNTFFGFEACLAKEVVQIFWSSERHYGQFYTSNRA